MPETLIFSLVPFIPPILDINDFFVLKSKSYNILLLLFHKLFSSFFKFHTVFIKYPFPFQIRTKNYELELFDSNDNFSSIPETRDELPVVECKNLVYTIKRGKTNIWPCVIKIFLQTKFKALAITLDDSINLIPLLHKELIDGCWKNLDIDQLTIKSERSFLNSPGTYSCLFDLVQNKRIKNIKYLDNFIETHEIKKETFDFLDWDCLNQISIEWQPINAHLVIPFSRLCQSLKKWKTIRFGSLFDYSFTDSNVSCSVEEIILDPCLGKESCEFVLKHCTGFTTLECYVELLDTCLPTKHLSTLQDLSLYIYENKNFDWTKLLVFPQLRSLSIQTYSDQHSDFANSLTSFVCQSQLEILNLDIKTENMLLILQNVYFRIEKQEMNKTKILSIDSEKDINHNKCSSNLKSLEIKLDYSTDFLTEEKEIISLCKQILKKHFVSEIILKYYVLNEFEFIHSLLVSSVSEGFILSRDKLDNISQLYQYERILIMSLDPKLN